MRPIVQLDGIIPPASNEESARLLGDDCHQHQAAARDATAVDCTLLEEQSGVNNTRWRNLAQLTVAEWWWLVERRKTRGAAIVYLETERCSVAERRAFRAWSVVALARSWAAAMSVETGTNTSPARALPAPNSGVPCEATPADGSAACADTLEAVLPSANRAAAPAPEHAAERCRVPQSDTPALCPDAPESLSTREDGAHSPRAASPRSGLSR